MKKLLTTTPIYKEIDCEIYKKEITVFFGAYEQMLSWAKEAFINPSYKEFLEELEKQEPGGADCHYSKNNCIVRLDKYPETPEEMAYLAHELLHATMFVMDSVGIVYTEWSNNESFTYLLEWLTKKSLEEDGYKTFTSNEENTADNSSGGSNDLPSTDNTGSEGRDYPARVTTS